MSNKHNRSKYIYFNSLYSNKSTPEQLRGLVMGVSFYD